MTGLEVIKLAVNYLGDKDLANIEQLGGSEIATEQQVEAFDTLKIGLNDIVASLATLYFPLKAEESLSSVSKTYYYKDFSKEVVDVLKVFNDNYIELEFAQFPKYLECKADRINVIYNYLPASAEDLNVELEVDQKVNIRTCALGVVSRFYLMRGAYTDAQAWEDTFERSILIAKRKKTPATIKKRRWI